MNKGITDIPQRIEEVVLGQVTTGNYQRPISQARANRIAASFDPAKLGVLVVSHRPDGSYTILDGQHRMAALRMKNIERAMAIVLEGMTLEQEADYFRRQNENAATLNCYDLFNAGVVALDPHYLAIDAILRTHNFIASHNSGPGQVTAVSALSRIALMFGFDVLDRVFDYITATWPTDTVIVRREMLAGLAEFVSRYGRSVDPQKFAARMRDKHPSVLFSEYRRRTEAQVTARNAFNQSMRFVLCAVLVGEYNKGLSGTAKQRLKLDWNMPVFEYEGSAWQ